MTLIKARAALACAALLAPSYAFATTHVITETYTIAPAAPSYSITFYLPGFDPSQGTLTNIELLLTATTTAVIDVYNADLTPETFTNATVSVPVTVVGPASTKVSATVAATEDKGNVPASFSLDYFGTNYTIFGSSVYSGVTGTETNSVSVPYLDFSEYEGPTLTLPFTATAYKGTYGGTADPGVNFGGSAIAGGSFELIFTYTTPGTPEASTWAMMGLGFVGLGFAGWRSARKSARYVG